MKAVGNPLPDHVHLEYYDVPWGHLFQLHSCIGCRGQKNQHILYLEALDKQQQVLCNVCSRVFKWPRFPNKCDQML